MWEKSDLAAIAMSFACLGIAVAVLQRNRAVSWRLGFNDQIIVIGFLLSTVQFVTRKIASTAFLILESRWGSSSLQNYDAILRNGIFLSHTGLGWRIIIALFTFLPLALSVGYTVEPRYNDTNFSAISLRYTEVSFNQGSRAHIINKEGPP